METNLLLKDFYLFNFCQFRIQKDVFPSLFLDLDIRNKLPYLNL